MTKKYEIENLLRYPVELQSSAVSFVFMCMCITAPYQLSITPTVSYLFALLFFISCLKRFKEGMFIVSYQRGLKRLPRYTISLSKIKASDTYLFMGKGFKWKEIHTERLYSARENHKFTDVSPIYISVRNFEYKYERGILRPLTKLTSIDSVFNPFRPYPDIGGDAALHGVGVGEERDITMRLSNRYGHHIVVGSTRVGKSRKAETYITQDIKRNKDDLIVVFDPKGDPDLLKRIYIEALNAGRLSELMIFHLGFPDISCVYNPLDSFTRLTELSTRITGSLPEDGDSKAFKDFAWQFTNIFSKGMFFYGDVPDYQKIKKAFKRPDLVLVSYVEKYLNAQGIEYKERVTQIEEVLTNRKTKKKNNRSVKAEAYCVFIDEKEIYDAALEDLIYINNLDSEYFAKISSAIAPFLEKVTSGKIGDLLSGGSGSKENKPVLDWMSMYKRGGIVYIGLDALTDVEIASAIGEATFSALTSMAGYLYKHDVNAGTPYAKKKTKNVIIHADEFSDLIGSKFVPLVNKSGGANFQLTLYTQTMSDIEVKLGTESKANQVMTNLNTIEFMRTPDEKTANIMIKKLPEVSVSTIMAVSASRDSADGGENGGLGFVSTNEDRTSTQRVSMLEVADIAGLSKGQSFCLMDGNQLYKLRSPMPSKYDHNSLPDSLSDVVAKMKDAYQSDIGWSQNE